MRAAGRHPPDRADPAAPLALAVAEQGGLRLSAVNRAAAAEGVRPGMTVADARAVCLELRLADADPPADAKALVALAGWCERYSPWVAVDGADGIAIDISGVAHLFGGEAALVAELLARLARLAITGRAAVADSPAAAWGWARYGPPSDADRDADRDAMSNAVLAPGDARAGFAGLPVAALRLPAAVTAELDRLGLGRVGDLYELPRAPLTARLGPAVGRRLDQMLGAAAEPISPARPVPPFRVRLAWPEPIGHLEAVAAATDRLLRRLEPMLERDRQGARRLELALYRIDGTVARIAVGTARASREARHLMRLFAEKLDGIDLGFGVEAMVLAAVTVEPVAARQLDLADRPGGGLGVGPGVGSGVGSGGDGAAFDRLVDRLANRLGPANVVRLVAVDSHIPERAVTLVPVADPPGSPQHRLDWAASQPRPLRLLPCPEPIEAMAPVPDDPPIWFRWRKVAHRVARADGPERIAPEWWRAEGRGARVRDYYRLEDTDGRRFWVYRDGLFGEPAGAAPGETPAEPRWYLHGLFA